MPDGDVGRAERMEGDVRGSFNTLGQATSRRGSLVWSTVLACAFAVGSFAIPTTALGYNGTAAAAWADTHATSYVCWSPGNPNALPCNSNNDCADFVSQALHYGGGYVENLGTGDVTNDMLWFLTKNGLNLWVQSNSWAYVSDHYTFQILHSPGGYLYGSASGTSTALTDGLSPGDIIYYDWDGNGTLDHNAMQTTRGTDPVNHRTGDLVDERTSDRSRVWWTLEPYNGNKYTTIIGLMHIFPSN